MVNNPFYNFLLRNYHILDGILQEISQLKFSANSLFWIGSVLFSLYIGHKIGHLITGCCGWIFTFIWFFGGVSLLFNSLDNGNIYMVYGCCAYLFPFFKEFWQHYTIGAFDGTLTQKVSDFWFRYDPRQIAWRKERAIEREERLIEEKSINEKNDEFRKTEEEKKKEREETINNLITELRNR